jgi:quercetin dioxygenase-like cupin family protein
MKSRWILALVFVIGVVSVSTGVVLATPGTGFVAAQQWKGVFGEMDLHTVNMPGHQIKLKTKGISDVYVTRNAVAVGGQSGWHTHPGPSLIIVTVGEITAYDASDPTCTPKRYKVGDGFVDPGDGHVHLLRNETDAPAETVAVQFLPTTATRRIDAPAAGNCAF